MSQPAGAQLRVRAAAVDRRQRDGEAGQREDQPAAEDVAHVAQRQREVVSTGISSGTVA